MKKSLASIFASLLLLVSVGASAAVISATDDSGLPGQSVTLTVRNEGFDMPSGAAFRVGFTDQRLQSPVFAEAGDFFLFSVGTPTGGDLFLACVGSGTCNPSEIFTLTLFIASGAAPGDAFVTYDWYGFDETFGDSSLVLPQITSKVTIGKTVPEPGVLGLTGLALLIMTVVGRRRRENRGQILAR